MIKREPQFDVGKVTWMRMPYPHDRITKDVMIKKEAACFEEKIRRDLCTIKGSGEEKS